MSGQHSPRDITAAEAEARFGGGGGNATQVLHSTGDINDPIGVPFTADNSGIKQVDVNDIEMLRVWGSGPTGSLYIGDSLPVGLVTAPDFPSDNVVIGIGCMPNITGSSPTGNTAIGRQALEALTTGSENTAVGENAGQSIEDGSTNVFIGGFADAVEPAAVDLVIIGNEATADEGVTENAIAIGGGNNNPVHVIANNTAVIGNSDITDVYFGSVDGASNIHGKSCQVSDFLQLTPTADPPGTPIEGMIYADTDHHLYFYNGTTWKQLDN